MRECSLIRLNYNKSVLSTWLVLLFVICVFFYHNHIFQVSGTIWKNVHAHQLLDLDFMFSIILFAARWTSHNRYSYHGDHNLMHEYKSSLRIMLLDLKYLNVQTCAPWNCILRTVMSVNLSFKWNLNIQHIAGLAHHCGNSVGKAL